MDSKELPARLTSNSTRNKQKSGKSFKDFRAAARRPRNHSANQEIPPAAGKLPQPGIRNANLLLPSAIDCAEHGFRVWPSLRKQSKRGSREFTVSQFELAADAIVNGDVATLMRLLRENPGLILERSTREHGATLLHCVSAMESRTFVRRPRKTRRGSKDPAQCGRRGRSGG